MTALVSSHSTFLSSSHSNPGGILRNPRSFPAPLHSRYQRDHRQPFASSYTPDPPVPTWRAASARKIRFAPLPDPRRDDSAVFQEDSDSDPQTSAPPSRAAPTPTYQPSLPPSPRLAAQATTDADPFPDDITLRDPSAKSKPMTWRQKFLRPLLQPLRSSNPKPADDPSAFILISSRESTRTNGATSDEGLNPDTRLARRMSTGSRDLTFTKEAERSQNFRDGVPLTHASSEGGATGSKGRKDGYRMLNGRVYGRRPSSADPERAKNHRQANYEPEFVEWGYGGMGSVNDDHSRVRNGSVGSVGPDWAKLQSRGKVLGEGDDADPDGDDGSGMGWVRRRREQREREMRDKENREVTPTGRAVPEIELHAHEREGMGWVRRRREQREREIRDKENREGTQTYAAVPEIEVHPPERDGSNAPEPSPHHQPKDGEEHHIYRAVSVPAPHHHRHHKSGDMSASGSVTPTSSPSLSRVNSAGSVSLTRTPSLGSRGGALLALAENKHDIESSSGSSFRSSASESLEDEDDDTERESDEDEVDVRSLLALWSCRNSQPWLAQEQSRITSKCAGVEKVSRHKE